MRGRNRRGPNPLTRSFESNGPDVKVRGTAQHVAEKYTQLARDAHVSGDPVMAESYLQHAEHYYRLIAAAHQAQIALQNGTADENDDDDDFDTASDRFNVRAVQQTNQQPGQPAYSGERSAGEAGEGGEGEGDDQPQERQAQDRQSQDRPDRNQGRERQHNNDRNNNRGRDRNQDRNFRQNNDRPNNDRNAGGERNQDRDRNPDRSGFQERSTFNQNRPRRPQPDLEGAEQPILPAFLTAPVRAIPIEVPEAVAAPALDAGEAGEAGQPPFRARRRRRGRIGAEGVEGASFEAETSGSDQT